MSEPTPGQLITPTLRLIRPLGEGGMGAVWVAEHLGLHANVVIKFMSPDLAATEEGKARFSKEAASTAQVRSPHVVQTLDYGVTDDNVPYIVMEQLDGHDLGQEIDAHGRVASETVVSIVTQLSRALSRVHDCGIVHRDIKPSNIFLCDAGDGEIFVKLLDFGVAKTHKTGGLGDTTNTGAILGTPYYMSPEQIMGAKEIDHRSDLWAVAVVVYEALTGSKPFVGDTVGGLAVQIMRDPLPVPSTVEPSVPPGFDAWFAKACARDAKDRFGSAKEMSDALAVAFSLRVPLSGSQPKWRPVVATSERPPANTGEAFAPTALDASTPGVRGGVAKDALDTQRSVAHPASSSRTWIVGLALGVGLLGIALGFGVPRLMQGTPAELGEGVVADLSAPVSTGIAAASDVPSATSPIVSADPPVAMASSAPTEAQPPPVPTAVRTAGKTTATVAAPPTTSAPPAAPPPKPTSTRTPGSDDDIW